MVDVLPIAAFGLGFEIHDGVAAAAKALMSRAERDAVEVLEAELSGIVVRARRLMPVGSGASLAGIFMRVHADSTGRVEGRVGVQGVPHFRYVRWLNAEAARDRIKIARASKHAPRRRDLQRLKRFTSEHWSEHLSGKSAFVELFQKPAKVAAGNVARAFAGRLSAATAEASRAA